MTGQEDLFGNVVEPPPPPRSQRVPVNDMDLVERVIAVAESDGYALVGPAERVFRIESKTEITPAPAHEAEAVHQLLDVKWLTKGGNHSYRYNGREGPGNSVLVPRATKEKARLWRNLSPLNGRKTLRAVANG